MQIFVRTLTSRYLTLDVCGDDSIGRVKKWIECREGVNSDAIVLYRSGVALNELLTVRECGIQTEDTIQLSLRLLGGAKKRKKKNYTTPKKNKHKKKKVKMQTLRYYRVDDNGKITRLRRECIGEECGAGSFMANHFDRQYCGKCGLTYAYKRPKK